MLGSRVEEMGEGAGVEAAGGRLLELMGGRNV